MNQELTLVIRPLDNQLSFTRFALTINPAKTVSVEQLTNKIAKKVSYYPECLHLIHNNQLMRKEQTLKQLKVQDGDHIVVVFGRRQYKVPQNVEPLVVGGIDLTDIKEFQHLLKKKEAGYVRNAELPGIGGAVGGMQEGQQSQRGPRVPDRGEVDLKVLYANQLAMIKDMGIEDEERILVVLASTNGNVEQALDQLCT